MLDSISEVFVNGHPFATSSQESYSNRSSQIETSLLQARPAKMPVTIGPLSHRDVPTGNRPGMLSVHTYTLDTTGGIPWMTVKLRSHVSSLKAQPVCIGGRSVSGRVELDLEIPEKIKAIVLTVRGQYRIDEYGPRTFLSLSETLWDCSMGDPRSADAFLSQGYRHAGRLYGGYSWPFSIDLPKVLSLSNKQERALNIRDGEQLPPSIGTDDEIPSIRYQLIVEVKRHAWRCNSRLSVDFDFISSQPRRASSSHQDNHRTEAPIQFSEIDPSGWKVFSDIEMSGLFMGQETMIKCSFALPIPLAYTRESIIPCILIVESLDHNLLMSLSPHAPRIHLRRCLKLQSERGSGSVGPNDVFGVSSPDEEDVLQSKAFWTSLRDLAHNVDSFQKIVHGKITLSPILTPSFTFGVIHLKYFVDVYPFDIPGFQPSNEDRLLSVEITITSMHIRETYSKGGNNGTGETLYADASRRVYERRLQA